MKILHNVVVHTMDNVQSIHSAIAWDNDRIIAVGDKENLFRKIPNAEKIDGKGCSVLPGFIDPHIHLLSGLLWKISFSCTPEEIPTIEELKEKLNKTAQNTRKNEWIMAQGFDPLVYPLNRYDLDEVCHDKPVMIIHWSCHEAVGNSKALFLAGIDRKTDQPFGGEIKKDFKGYPTGHLVETAMIPPLMLGTASIIENSKNRLLDSLNEAQTSLFSKGITRICDTGVSSEYEDLYNNAINKNIFKIPISICHTSDKGLFLHPWDKLDHKPGGENSEQMITGPLKIFMDGAVCCSMILDWKQALLSSLVSIIRSVKTLSLDPIRIAMRSPIHLGRALKFHIGIRTIRYNDLLSIVDQAVDKGFTLAFHAIGNQAVDQAIRAIGHVRKKYKHYPPPRIEHCLFINDELIRQISDLDIAVVTQPLFLKHMDSKNVPYLHNIKQLPLRSLIDSGVRVSGSSDWPAESFNPLSSIERAVTRITRGTERLQEQEAITINEALSMHTREAAYVMGCSNKAGSLENGKRSDFILLSKDPLTLKEGDWDSLQVHKTYLGGEPVFSRE